MITTLYMDAKLDKQLQLLNRSDKKAALAAEHAQEIISKLKGGQFSSMEVGPTTKHGEQRIKGCIKYDLGGGYRLVTLKQGRDLYLLYAGSHDGCHRWIENNRELPVVDIRKRSLRIPIETVRLQPNGDNDDMGVADQEENDGFSRELEDHQLRTIFSGLIDPDQN